ncbi:MAG: ABC transporter permease [Chitinivibrionales bacterium]
MNMYLRLAWRNLWRNKRRTVITMASVYFAVILVLFTRSMQLGTYEHIINNTLKLYTGYIQVHGAGYWDHRSLENSMSLGDTIIDSIEGMKAVTHVVPRLESFALASSGEQTRGAMVMGIDPQKENAMAELARRIENGEYLDSGDAGALVGTDLAENLQVGVGDTIVLLGQGYYGVSAAGKYAVSGIIDMPEGTFDAGVIYLSLTEAQWLYAAEGRLTSLAIMVSGPEQMAETMEMVGALVDTSTYEVMGWREMVPELVQSIELDNVSGLIMLGILYLVIGFGVFGTVMMMVAERRRESAVLVAAGMRRSRLSLLVFLETLIIGIAGTIAGALSAWPILLYMRANPIVLSGSAAQAMREYGYDPLIPFLVEPSIFFNQALVVLCITFVAVLYPIYSNTRFKLVDTLRS